MKTAAALALGLAAHAASGAEPTLRLPAADVAPASLTIDAHDSHVALAWYGGVDGAATVNVAVSDDHGRTFGPARVVGDAATRRAMPKPRVALDERQVVIVWPDADGNVGVARSIDRGRSFARHTLTARTAASAELSAAAVAPDGSVHTLWSGADTLFYAQARTGAVATAVRVDDAATSCRVAALTVRGTDVLIVWHRTFADGQRDFAAARAPAGGTVEAPQRVSVEKWGFAACPGAAPSLSVDRNGAVRFAFQATPPTSPPAPTFFVDRSRDGKAFVPRSFLDFGRFDDARYPAIAADDDGGLALVWDGIRNERRYVMIRHSLGAPGGTGDLDGDWMRPSPPIVLDQSGDGGSPVVAASGDGMLAAWISTERTGPGIRTRRLSIDELCGDLPR